MTEIPNPVDGKRQWVVPCSCVSRFVHVITTKAGVADVIAVTIGDDTYQVSSGELTDATRKHEDCHVAQIHKFQQHGGKWLGSAAFWALYTYNHFRYGYRANPFEVEARAAESAVTPSASSEP